MTDEQWEAADARVLGRVPQRRPRRARPPRRAAWSTTASSCAQRPPRAGRRHAPARRPTPSVVRRPRHGRAATSTPEPTTAGPIARGPASSVPGRRAAARSLPAAARCRWPDRGRHLPLAAHPRPRASPRRPRRLPDLAALGVSHLYLSPIAEAVPGLDPRLRRHRPDPHPRASSAARTASRALVDGVPRRPGSALAHRHRAQPPRRPPGQPVVVGPAAARAGAAAAPRSSTSTGTRRSASCAIRAPRCSATTTAASSRPATSRSAGATGRAGSSSSATTTTSSRCAGGRRRRSSPRSPAAPATTCSAWPPGVLARVEDATVDLDDRDADLAVAERTALARLADPAVAAAPSTPSSAAINADADRLDAVPRPASTTGWPAGRSATPSSTTGGSSTSTRSSATRMERPDAFDLLHRLPAELRRPRASSTACASTTSTASPTRPATSTRLRGARRPDGLAARREDPAAAARTSPPWPVDGTTGYEVADLLGGWLTDPAGADALTRRLARARPASDRTLRARSPSRPGARC